MKIKNIEAAKKLLGKYKSITLEQLENYFKLYPYLKGKGILNRITHFGSMNCLIYIGARCFCRNCIYSFRPKEKKLIFHVWILSMKKWKMQLQQKNYLMLYRRE